MFYSAPFDLPELIIGVAALFVGFVYLSVGVRELNWRHSVLGMLLIASGRYMCLRSFGIL